MKPLCNIIYKFFFALDVYFIDLIWSPVQILAPSLFFHGIKEAGFEKFGESGGDQNTP